MKKERVDYWRPQSVLSYNNTCSALLTIYVRFIISTRWALPGTNGVITPSKLVTEVIALFKGVITPIKTGGGAQLVGAFSISTSTVRLPKGSLRASKRWPLSS